MQKLFLFTGLFFLFFFLLGYTPNPTRPATTTIIAIVNIKSNFGIFGIKEPSFPTPAYIFILVSLTDLIS